MLIWIYRAKYYHFLLLIEKWKAFLDPRKPFGAFLNDLFKAFDS